MKNIELMKIWEKDDRKRGYLTRDAIEAALGLKVERYKSGNPKRCTMDGYPIANNRVWNIEINFKNEYLDLNTGKWSFDASKGYGKRIAEFFA